MEKQQVILFNRKGINRYMLECKCFKSRNYFFNNIELIDTCWNVNFGVDVDTLAWAVRINRYMLECKLIMRTINNFIGERINRYMLECKSTQKFYILNYQDRINRYMLECKWMCVTDLCSLIMRINRYMLECKSTFGARVTTRVIELIDTCWNVNTVHYL